MMESTGTTTATTARRYKVAGMDCGSCAMTIEAALSRLAGVERAQVDFTTETLQVEGVAPLATLAAAVAKLGYRLDDAADIRPASAPAAMLRRPTAARRRSGRVRCCNVSGTSGRCAPHCLRRHWPLRWPCLRCCRRTAWFPAGWCRWR